jgi:hypothetical protein
VPAKRAPKAKPSQRPPAAALVSALSEDVVEASLGAALKLLRAGPVEVEWDLELDDLQAALTLGEGEAWLVYLGNVGNWLCERAEGGACRLSAAGTFCPHLLAVLVALVQTRSVKLGDLRTQLSMGFGLERSLAAALEGLRVFRRDARKRKSLSRVTTRPEDFAGL